MATKTPSRNGHTSVERALADNAARARYDLRQRDFRRGRGSSGQRARPLEFDERGFPIAQPAPSFTRRVRSLIYGD
jgi:hypothetical protein